MHRKGMSLGTLEQPGADSVAEQKKDTTGC